jgi:general secretion pathway protein A
LTRALTTDLYLEYWGIQEFPFGNSQDPRFFYPSHMHVDALNRVQYAIHTAKGCVLLSGEYGCGKTALVRQVIQRLEPAEYDIALINYPMFSEGEFLREILLQYGIEAQSATRLELFRRISTFALQNAAAGKRNLIIIDEAQLLENSDDFEQLRMLLNVQLNDQNAVTLFLVGQPEVRERIMRFPQLDQRVNVRCHLSYFDLADTAAYIQYRLRTAGATREIFSAGAEDLIYQSTHGVPRLLNNICDLALYEGFSRNAPVVTEEIVRTVI